MSVLLRKAKNSDKLYSLRMPVGVETPVGMETVKGALDALDTYYKVRRLKQQTSVRDKLKYVMKCEVVPAMVEEGVEALCIIGSTQVGYSPELCLSVGLVLRGIVESRLDC